MLSEAYGTSPFPGMNPYLEGPVNWSDFHATFIHCLRDAINEQLPDAYYARVTELVMMVTPELPQTRSRVGPDILVGREPSWTPGSETSAASASTAVLEPETNTNVIVLDPYTELQIELLRMPSQDVVTVFELFSPTNKYGDGRGAYEDKRNRLMHKPVNLVELDLIRAGPRIRLERSLPGADYFCFVSRANRRPNCDVYAWTVKDALPTIPIPLREPDVDVHLALDKPFRQAFFSGQYGRFIDYSQSPPAPSFCADVTTWIAAQVSSPLGDPD